MINYRVDVLCWIISTLITYALSRNVTLSPSVVEVAENGSVTLTCSYNGIGTHSISLWPNSVQNSVPAAIMLENGSCSANGYLNNSDLYEWTCKGNGVFSLTLKNVKREDNGVKWWCFENLQRSNTVEVFVKEAVPVDMVTINPTGHTTVVENSYGELGCVTSYSRPVPVVLWYLNRIEGKQELDEMLSTEIKHSFLRDASGLKATNSSLIYRAHRSLNGRFVYCSASNDLNFSVRSENLLINVMYQAEIEAFYINDYVGETTFTVDENDTVNLVCLVDSNPKSTIRLYQSHTLVLGQMDTNKLNFSLYNISCFQAGIYSCVASNIYNKVHYSREHIILLVRCPPKISPRSPHRFKQISNIGFPVSFTFTTLDYLETGPVGFRWQKYNGSAWVELMNTDNINISSSGIQSNLTISAVTEHDYGQYRLTVSNPVGTLSQIFSLEAPDENLSQIKKQWVVVLLALLSVLFATGVIILSAFIYRKRVRHRLTKKCNNDVSLTNTQSAARNMTRYQRSQEEIENNYPDSADHGNLEDERMMEHGSDEYTRMYENIDADDFYEDIETPTLYYNTRGNDEDEQSCIEKDNMS